MEPGDGVRWRLYAEAFRTWTPLVISLCAISLTIFQAAATRRHTRLSVQPRVDWRIFADTDTGVARLSLVNVGFGPALVNDIALTFAGTPLGPDHLGACDALNAAIGRDGAAWDTACFAFGEDTVLRPGDEVVLYASEPDEAAGWTPKDDLDFDPRTISVTARYCSFYADCWTMDAE